MMHQKNTEWANALTHGMGFLFFIAAGPAIVSLAIAKNNVGLMWASMVYIFGLLMSYGSSTAYHAITDPEYKRWMRMVDHVSIFLLIGGTFTPLVIAYMGEWDGRRFLFFFWTIIAAGMIYKLFHTGKHRLVSTLFYVAIAWAGAGFSGPVLTNMPQRVLHFLLLGGLFYTLGTVFYLWKKLTYHHAIWHLFVLGGSISHYLGVSLALRTS